MAPPKRQKGVDISKTLFGADKHTDSMQLDQFADHHYDEPQQPATPTTPGGASRFDGRHVYGTAAAKLQIGDFRKTEATLATQVPENAEGPYVAFVKHFGKNMDELALRSYFEHLDVKRVQVVSTGDQHFGLVEVGSRADLIRALTVSGTVMHFQFPCTISVASAEQIQKMQRYCKVRTAHRSDAMGGAFAQMLDRAAFAPSSSSVSTDDVPAASGASARSSSMDNSAQSTPRGQPQQPIGRSFFGTATPSHAPQRPAPPAVDGEQHDGNEQHASSSKASTTTPQRGAPPVFDRALFNAGNATNNGQSTRTENSSNTANSTPSGDRFGFARNSNGNRANQSKAAADFGSWRK